MALDWVGTLGTGIVGLAGIAATYWSASKARIAQAKDLQFRINADNDRIRLTDQRRIYAAFMGAVSSYVVIGQRLATA